MNKEELRIYYLFMLVDGACSEGEIEKFDSICKAHNIDSTKKDTIKSECEKALELSEERSRVINEKICENADELMDSYSLSKKRVIWTLLNLGYSDEDFSAPEKEIVDMLAQKFKMDTVDFDEMIDSAETILSLIKEKEWLKTTDFSGDEVTKGITKIDEAIKNIYSNIEVLIGE